MAGTYLILLVAIAFEVFATTVLKSSDGFTRPLPTVIALVAYVCSFYFLSLSLRVIPVGVVYALWSGAGIVFITAISWFVYRQVLDIAALAGVGLILAGVVVINLFSGSIPR